MANIPLLGLVTPEEQISNIRISFVHITLQPHLLLIYKRNDPLYIHSQFGTDIMHSFNYMTNSLNEILFSLYYLL